MINWGCVKNKVVLIMTQYFTLFNITQGLSVFFILCIIGCGSSNNGNTVSAPVITLIGDDPLILVQGSDYNEPGATATDEEDGDVTVTISGTVDINTIDIYTITYSATDSDDNTTEVTRNVHVVIDPVRFSNIDCIPPEPIIGGLGQVDIEARFVNLPTLSSPLAMVQPSSDSSFWFVALRAGRIVNFDNTSTANNATTVLDISSRVSTTLEMGMTGLAFHPDYPTDNRIFVVYNDLTQQGRSTLSSFNVNTTTRMVDPDSEEVFLTLDQPANNHNGGDIAFGPNGLLYVAFGDGGANANESQDLTNLLGTMIRIDVSTSPYTIPESNPLNTGQTRCDTGERSGNDTTHCPEIYAYGFRNPWRWSFDSETGDLWLADVGQRTFEEVNKVIINGNYGWPIMEANACFNNSNCDTTGLQLPITQYPRSVGVSTVGGYVYRGDDYPNLVGQYIWGDTFSQQFLSIPANASVGSDFTPIFSSGRTIAAMAQGNDGEIYLLNLNGGSGNTIFQVTSNGGEPTSVVMPTQLSQVGCFNTQTKSSSTGVVDYNVLSPLWSDGADKQRSFAIPDGETIEITNEGDFLFPTDTVLIKHFLDNDRFLETRLFIHHPFGWRGYSYEWNTEQTDAILLDEGKTVDINGFVHTFPSSSECAICHTNAANHSLGLEVPQLNAVNPALGINQLDFLSEAGYLSELLDSEDEPQLYALDDGNATLEQRARSYLHSNCSGCHRPGSTASFMDLRITTELNQTNTCNVQPSAGNLGVNNAFRLSPRNADRSVLLLRMETLSDDRMPPLASSRVDQAAVDVIRDWINSLQDCD